MLKGNWRLADVAKQAKVAGSLTKKRRTSQSGAQVGKPSPSANVARRRPGRTGYEEEWEKFVASVEAELAAAFRATAEFGKSPYYAPANVVKRAVYRFVISSHSKIKLSLIERTIDLIRVAHAGGKVLRPLRKDFRRDGFFWVLTGLHLDCPAANLRKSDVTRFAQHLKYARRHRVPPEYLIGFLLQTGSLAEVYRRAQDPERREQWYLDKVNS
ncbi:hypothetical protein OLX02_13985 [Novosphingobium sp. KCTC 2891]|uniref:hypothetical protein n=1 Tax=Novosphingobium sp. KCTC 2891 TaxID=2989730 RepID=UPI0022226B04|nr:hypothetical protein [Novosphingobium sp. KCTC 2891]MCW1383929.1 hypothetical protein [Novosphingobium sp. KCTC 2891]